MAVCTCFFSDEKNPSFHQVLGGNYNRVEAIG